MDDITFFHQQLRKNVLQNTAAVQNEEAQDITPAALLKRRETSRSTTLLEKRKEMLEVQQALDAQKEEFAKHEQNMLQREKEWRARDNELQESLVKFNRFLLDNDSKRSEAEKKFLEAKRFREQKEQEIAKLQEALESLKKEEEDKKKALQKHQKFLVYLNSVLEKTEEYKEIKFLIERWKTLKATSDSLRQSSEVSGKQIEIEKTSSQKYTEEKANEILGYNNQIANLQKSLEEKTDKSLQEENEADEKAETVVAKTLECSQIKMACDNIFRRILERNKQKYKKTSTFRQIQLIGMFMADYIDIIKFGMGTASAVSGNGSNTAAFGSRDKFGQTINTERERAQEKPPPPKSSHTTRKATNTTL